MEHTRHILEIMTEFELIDLNLDWLEGYIDYIYLNKKDGVDDGELQNTYSIEKGQFQICEDK